ncbi:MAG: FUSC family protein [Clostridium sp.]
MTKFIYLKGADMMSFRKVYDKTKMFIGIILFIIVFKSIFGDENTLIGVTVVTALLILLQRDLTANIYRFFVIFAVINVGQGILAYITNYNVYLGIPATFIAMVVTGYLFTYNLKSPLFVGFGLQYLFMLYYPVSYEQLPLRLISLFVGAIIIMASQLIFNRNRLTKSSMAIMPGIVSNITNKIDSILGGEYNQNDDAGAIALIRSMRKEINESRESYFHTTIEGKVGLNLTIGLERATILLDRIYFDQNGNKNELNPMVIGMLRDMRECISYITVDREKKQDIEGCVNKINSFIKHYSEEISTIDNEDLKGHFKEILENMDFLQHNLKEIVEVDDFKYKRYVRRSSIPENFKTTFVLRKHFKLRSLKMSYALRSAIMITITVFMVNYFNIVDGKWLVFTMFAIIQPFEHQGSKKSKQRLFGTLIGLVVFTVVFTLITNQGIYPVLLMLSGYIASYQTNYGREMIFITFSALGEAALSSGFSTALVLHRAAYVILGIVIAIIANKVILPYKIEDGNRDLVNIYNDIIVQVKEEINKATRGEGNIQNMRNLIMYTSFVEERLYTNLSDTDKEERDRITEELRSNRILVNDLYDEYLGVYSKNRTI